VLNHEASLKHSSDFRNLRDCINETLNSVIHSDDDKTSCSQYLWRLLTAQC